MPPSSIASPLKLHYFIHHSREFQRGKNIFEELLKPSLHGQSIQTVGLMDIRSEESLTKLDPFWAWDDCISKWRSIDKIKQH